MRVVLWFLLFLSFESTLSQVSTSQAPQLMDVVRASLSLLKDTPPNEITDALREAIRAPFTHTWMVSAMKRQLISMCTDKIAVQRGVDSSLGTQSLVSLPEITSTQAYSVIGVLLVVILLLVAYVVLYVRARRRANLGLRNKGKHSFRSYSDCTPAELSQNKPYLLQRGAWNPGNILHHERTAPTPNCKYAAIVESLAFSEVSGHGGISQEYLERGGLGHTAIMYFYDGAVQGRTAAPNEVLVTEMCHSFFCDVPEDKDIPEVEKQYILDSKPIYEDSQTLFSIYDHVSFPVGTCTYSLREDSLPQSRWVVIDKPSKLMLKLWPDELKQQWQFDCQLMFEAEQTAYEQFDFTRSWVIPTHDCNSHGALIREALNNYYHNPHRPQGKGHVTKALEQYLSHHNIRDH